MSDEQNLYAFRSKEVFLYFSFFGGFFLTLLLSSTQGELKREWKNIYKIFFLFMCIECV